MKSLLILAVAFLPLLTLRAEPFSAFFRYESGPRIDFTGEHPKGELSDDKISETAVLHILIPDEGSGNIAQVSLAYGKGAEGRQDTSFRGVVFHRTEDMISIICAFGEADKIENLVVYPKKGIGFQITHSAYLGSALMKALADTKPTVPFATASILRLRQHKE